MVGQGASGRIMYEHFTDRARKVMQLANQEAQRYNHEYIGTEHILLGLVKEGSGVAVNVLKNLDIDLRKVRLEVEKLVQSGPDMVSMGKLPQTPRTKKVVEYAIEEARNLNHNYAGTEHLLLGLIREEEGVAAQVLMNLGLKLSDLRAELLNLLGQDIRPGVTVSPQIEESGALLGFGLDLTMEAKKGKLTSIVGRKDELEQILLILGCMAQNNVILVGSLGVGKKAVIRGLAHLSAGEDWPATLKRRRFVALNICDVIATTDNDEQVKRRLRSLMTDLRIRKDVLVYLDDFRRIVDSPGSLVAEFIWSAFRSALAKNQIQCIAIATPEQYQSHICDDPILGWHFQPVFIEPMTPAQTLEVLRTIRPVYEVHHCVEITEDALGAAIELSDIHVKDQHLPRKAIRILDLACSLIRICNIETPPDLKELKTKIDRLIQEKEGAVAEQDFERAAHLCDQANQLKQRRRAIEAKWNQELLVKFVKVDRQAVEQAVARMARTRSNE
jgi:ATP-dependent Clp protease ATP-binding subunit ClpC